MKTHIQTLTREQLASRQKRAIGGLLSHTLVFMGICLWVSYILLNLAGDLILSVVLLSLIMSPAVIPLLLAFQLYRGRFFRRWLQGWAGTWLIIGLFYLFGSLQMVPYYLTVEGLSASFLLVTLLILSSLIFFLIPSGLVLRLTGFSTWNRSIDIHPTTSLSDPFMEKEEE